MLQAEKVQAYFIRQFRRSKWLRWLCGLTLIFLLFFFIVPAPRFHDPCSTVLTDRNGDLLGARVAADEQWRFEPTAHLPDKYVRALLSYEDRYFYYHPGINPVSLAKSLYRNIHAGEIVSGGSTITMQLARLARKNPPRTYSEKFWEILMALKAELVYSKKKILQMYASHAPFGSNVVGLEAACWRFFGVAPDRLSWAQAATLAVLPNSPALIFPGKNQQALKRKRNRLLNKMRQFHIIDSLTFSLALEEPVPGPPKDIPQLAPQLAVRLINARQAGKRIATSLDEPLQNMVADIVDHYYEIYKDNHVYNAAALVIDVRTGKTLAYVGNTKDTTASHGGDVDVITAPRSYGSTLKPILYMAALDAGKICPGSLLPDYPVNLGGFAPKNFNIEFDGAVPADQALIRSLNVPNIFLLLRYGTPLFLNKLRNFGFTTFNKTATYYGLSFILGGGETNLWQLTGAYAALAHRLSTSDDPAFTVSFLGDSTGFPASMNIQYHLRQFQPAVIWTALNTLTELYRPGDYGHWQQFSSSEKIAWKTGTSFGNRDAWAVGITPRYAVGIWVGNASGEGRSGVTGIGYAAPLLFDVFSELPDTAWFQRPPSGWVKLPVCRQSGDRASVNCPDTVMEELPAGCAQSPVCSFHQLIHLDPTGRYRVSSLCMSPSDMQTKSWFVLPPAEEQYYRKRHTGYVPLPPVMKGCENMTNQSLQVMNLIYPTDGAKIYIPRERAGEKGKTVFQAAHRDAGAAIFWHVDNQYLGQTKGIHKMEINVPPGLHRFTLMDDKGNVLQFTVTFLQENKD